MHVQAWGRWHERGHVYGVTPPYPHPATPPGGHWEWGVQTSLPHRQPERHLAGRWRGAAFIVVLACGPNPEMGPIVWSPQGQAGPQDV